AAPEASAAELAPPAEVAPEATAAPAAPPAAPAEPRPTAAGNDFGRVDDAGSVFVKTADGEREVGSWQAGTPEEGLAHFGRRFEVISTEVALLEQRLRSGAGDPQQVAQTATRLKGSISTASAVGDLAALERRVDALLEKTKDAVEAGKAAKAEARARAAEAKAALATEAEQLAGSSDWKASGERLRTLGDDWKRLPHLDKKVEDELWQRIAAARKRFTERRTTHFGALEEQRTVSKDRKEKLITEAESLSGSTEWGPTAGRYKQLMSDWKTAGRAPREVEDDLWNRFKAAQDSFFTARNAHFSVQDEELRGNQKIKEEILAEAETIDPSAGLDKAKARLRTLQERWEEAGKVPRDVMRSLEDRMGAVEEKVRNAGESRFSRVEESPFTARLREKVAELETKLEKARTAGRPTEELEAALTTQKQWLSQAGGGSAAPSSSSAPAAGQAKKAKSSGGWVRAD
ncbi:MAG: hypothetical protein JWN08_2069, partial [Frankiales bacterium]|nr:hypothetical protein [Frankiales bacterium]